MLVVTGIDVFFIILAAWLGFQKKRVWPAMICFILAVIITSIYSYIIRYMPMGDIRTDIFNPTEYVQESEYINFWKRMFSTFLSGFWARFIAVTSLLAAFWFGIYRRRTGIGIFLFLTSVSATYLFSVVQFFLR